MNEALAEALVAAGDEEQMLEAENAILDHLNVSGDETEQGLTKNAVAQIELFVTENIGRPWTYADLPISQ